MNREDAENFEQWHEPEHDDLFDYDPLNQNHPPPKKKKNMDLQIAKARAILRDDEIVVVCNQVGYLSCYTNRQWERIKKDEQG